jgi:hypothetical protein
MEGTNENEIDQVPSKGYNLDMNQMKNAFPPG